MADQPEFINIIPTPAACRKYLEIFRQTKMQSQSMINANQAEIAQLQAKTDCTRKDEQRIRALICSIGEETQRITSMNEGIADLERCGY